MKNSGSTMLAKEWKWFAIVGAVVTLAGFIAIALPVATGVAITSIVGGIFIGIGLIQLYHIFSIPKWSAKLWYVISALLYSIGGILIIGEPFIGLLTITAMMITIMLFNGITRIFLGLNSRNSLDGWGWVVFSGFVSTAIAIYFFSLMSDPEFSLSIFGIFVGISFIFEGISFIFIGTEMKKRVTE